MPATKIYGDRKDLVQVHTQVPRKIHEQLRERAFNNHRTVTREVIAIVTEVLKREEAELQEAAL